MNTANLFSSSDKLPITRSSTLPSTQFVKLCPSIKTAACFYADETISSSQRDAYCFEPLGPTLCRDSRYTLPYFYGLARYRLLRLRGQSFTELSKFFDVHYCTKALDFISRPIEFTRMIAMSKSYLADILFSNTCNSFSFCIANKRLNILFCRIGILVNFFHTIVMGS